MARSKQQTRWNIEVGEEDIAKAHKNDSYKCVVAQSIARTIPDASNIDVDIQSIRFTRQGERFVYLTPYAVQGYVVAFDAGEEITSFAFQLRDPRKVARRRQTEAGRVITRTAKRVQRAQKKGDVLASAKARTELEAVKAAYVGAPRGTEAQQEGEGKTPPRVFKKRRRAYGHRMLRINQQVD
jgi:hypothetical protein